jgi:hypothetical protein
LKNVIRGLMLLVAVASAMVTIAFEEKFIESADVTGIPVFGSRVLLAMTTPWWYLKQLLVPVRLAPLYEIWNVTPGVLVWWAGPMAWLLSAIGVAMMWRRVSDDVRGLLLFSAAIFLMSSGRCRGSFPTATCTRRSFQITSVHRAGPFA